MQDRNNEILFSILGYFGPLVLIPILAGKDSALCKHHANQALVIFIAEIAAGIIASLSGFFFLFGIIGWLLSVACFVFMILGIISAAKYETNPLPIIGGIQIIR